MALEPITRKEKIIAGQDLTPITRMEMFLKQFCGGGGGSGFEYDFIIKTTDSIHFTLETGNYNSIIAKLGNQPVKGKIILNSEAEGQQKDMDCVLVGKNGEGLLACAFMGEAYIFVVINADNTVTSAG